MREVSHLAEQTQRHRLQRRLNLAAAKAQHTAAPCVVVDVDAFNANARALARRAAHVPIRVATKSLRVPALISRALATPGFRGILSYTLNEALWLARNRISEDILVAYPTTDERALQELVSESDARSAITLMIDDPAHVHAVEEALDQIDSAATVRVCIDVDAGLHLRRATIGPKRSPIRTARQAADLAVLAREAGLVVTGVMTYEGQVAGVPDLPPGSRVLPIAMRAMKRASIHQLRARRAAVAKAVGDLEFFNAGGTGSLESTTADPSVSEVAAGSGLLGPALFDHYRDFRPQPAMFFGVRVARTPEPGTVTVAGGGFIASGPAGHDRNPLPWAPPGLELTGLEGAGEVQTPLTGPGTHRLRVGDWVWFRHAKSGELAEHTNHVYLLERDGKLTRAETYRGLGHVW